MRLVLKNEDSRLYPNESRVKLCLRLFRKKKRESKSEFIILVSGTHFTMKNITTALFVFSSIILSLDLCAQGRFRSNANMNIDNNWNNPVNWTLISGTDPDLDGIPGASDTAELNTSHTCILVADVTCLRFVQRIGTTGGTPTVLTINNGVNFTATDRFIVNVFGTTPQGSTNVNGTLTTGRFNSTVDRLDADVDFTVASTGTMVINGASTSQWQVRNSCPLSTFVNDGIIASSRPLVFQARGGFSAVARNNGTMTTTRNFIIISRGVGSSMVFENNGTLNVGRDFRLNARNGADPLDNQFDMRFGGSVLNVSRDLEFTNSGGSILNDAANVSTVTMTRNGVQAILGSPMVSYHHLILDGNNIKTLNLGEIPEGNFHGDFTIDVGVTFNQNSFDVNTDGDVNLSGTYNANADLTCDGDMNVSGSYTSSGSDVSVGGNWNNTGTYTNSNGDNVTFFGSASQDINGATDWYEITIDNASGVIVQDDQNIFGILDIDDGDFDANGNIVTLISDASGTAQMDDIGTGSYTGDITVQRRISLTSQGWRELSMPITGHALSTWQSQGLIFSGFPNSSFPTFPFLNAYSYNEANANGVKNDGWVAASDANVDSPDYTNGFRIYMDATTFNLSETGAPNTGDVTINLSNDNEGTVDHYGWNLIGNPYPATVDWDLIDAGNKNGIIDAYFIYVTEGMVSPQYGVYVGGDGTGTNGVDGEIAHHQGFWVHCDGAFTGSNPSLTVQEEDKNVSVDNLVTKALGSPDSLLSIRMVNSLGLTFDEVLIKSISGASSDYVTGEDFAKLYNDSTFWSSTINLAVRDTVNGIDMVMSAIGKDSADVVLCSPVGADIHGETVMMKFGNLAVFGANRCLILEDLFTDSVHVLMAGEAYEFIADTNATDTRFVIHVLATAEFYQQDVSCFGESNGEFDVTEVDLGAYLDIWDSQGQLVVNSGPSDEHFIDWLVADEYTYAISDYGCGSDSLHGSLIINQPAEITASFITDTNVINIGESEMFTFTNLSTGAVTYEWDMGDGAHYIDEFEPIHDYTDPGVYEIVLHADNENYGECTKIITQEVEVIAEFAGILDEEISMYAIIQENQFVFEGEGIDWERASVSFYDTQGKLFILKVTERSHDRIIVNSASLPAGIYIAHINVLNRECSLKINK